MTLRFRIPLDKTLCHKVCQRLATVQWFSSGTPVSSTNKTDRDDITEILLKVAFSTITLTIGTLKVAFSTITLTIGTLKEIEKPNNLMSFWNKNTKGNKQDSQTRRRSPMTDGIES
jgi:hypothetical protein